MARTIGICRNCGQRFHSWEADVPGARPGKTRKGPGRELCGMCEPNDGGVNWSAIPADRERAERAAEEASGDDAG